MTTFDHHYLLKWADFQHSLLNSLDKLRNDTTFIDVTLSCEGQKYGAHRVLLAASSPYFKDLFQGIVGSHPIIILRETSARDLEALLEFIYNGEVNVPEEQVDSLLKTATDLQIKGLAQNKESRMKKGSVSNVNGGGTSITSISQVPGLEHQEVTHEEVVMDYNEPKMEPVVAEPSQCAVYQVHNDKSIIAMGPSLPPSKSTGFLACGYCGKTFKRRNALLDHEHMHKGTTICHICQRVCSTKGNLKQHLLKKHDLIAP